ncbi:MAG: GtrA family protein [Lactobacillus sp.]|nr:GtrA family protein [Lactobacillus sp.]
MTKTFDLGIQLLKRYRQFIAYVFFGCLTTLINMILFYLFKQVMSMSVLIANTLAFILATLASFVFNHVAVFTENKKGGSIFKKLISFCSFRVISLVPDDLIMIVGIDLLHFNPMLVKFVDQVVIFLINYITTKFVFQKQKSEVSQSTD